MFLSLSHYPVNFVLEKIITKFELYCSTFQSSNPIGQYIIHNYMHICAIALTMHKLNLIKPIRLELCNVLQYCSKFFYFYGVQVINQEWQSNLLWWCIADNIAHYASYFTNWYAMLNYWYAAEQWLIFFGMIDHLFRTKGSHDFIS